jgi:Cysteine rich repeat
MINTLRRAATLWASMATVIFAGLTPVFSQAPTDAQRSTIRSECRSDYQAHCASVPPGGADSLQCLQKNMSSLSSGCQTAVRAVEPPAAPKAESAPAAAPNAGSATAKPAETAAPAAPKAAADAAAKKPGSAQVAAIRTACRSDYQKVCAGVPTGGAPALQCLEKNKSKVSPACEQAVNAASGGGAAPAAGDAAATAATGSLGAAPAAAPAPMLVLRPMRPREELFVLRSACGGDVRALCGGIAPGGGRIVRCLATQAASLSPACQGVLGQFAAR